MPCSFLWQLPFLNFDFCKLFLLYLFVPISLDRRVIKKSETRVFEISKLLLNDVKLLLGESGSIFEIVEILSGFLKSSERFGGQNISLFLILAVRFLDHLFIDVVHREEDLGQPGLLLILLVPLVLDFILECGLALSDIFNLSFELTNIVIEVQDLLLLQGFVLLHFSLDFLNFIFQYILGILKLIRRGL